MADEHEEVPTTLETLREQLQVLLERQNAHYTEIMLKLQELQDMFGQDTREEVKDLYEDAVMIVRSAGKASTSYLQRKLGIGYNVAARLIDELEARRVIGAADGSRPREVLPFDEARFADEMSDRERQQGEEDDELYPAALKCVRAVGFASTELLQTGLGIGYAHAARLIDMLEERGVVAPGQGDMNEKFLLLEREDGEAA